MIRLLEGVNNLVINEQQAPQEAPALPPEILKHIFSGIPNRKDMDIQLFNGVNTLWSKTSITLIKSEESNSIHSLLNFLIENLEEMKYEDVSAFKNLLADEAKIKNSDNLKAIKFFSSQLQNKIVSLLEKLNHRDFNKIMNLKHGSELGKNLFAIKIWNQQKPEVDSEDAGLYLGQIAIQLAKIKEFDKAIDLASTIPANYCCYVERDFAYKHIVNNLLDENLFVKAAKILNLMDSGITKDSLFSTLLTKLKLNGRIEKVQDVADETLNPIHKQLALELVKQMERKD